MDKKFLQISEYYITKKPMLVGTLLGSCVSICLYNKCNGHAAMNHFLMPSAVRKAMQNNPGKYGESSCEMIIRSLMSIDPDASHYSAQIFGGGNMFSLRNCIRDIGERNIKIAEQVLAKHKIRIIRRKTGGTKGMKILFNTAKNQVDCRKLSDTKDSKRLQIQYEKAFKTIEEIFLKQTNRFPKDYFAKS
ncbi:MAG: chemotaxis protein CheD [Candidatus Desulfatibia sp.]|uniref:chemotaxis protein CheD n=1 Tax=Candidatus Desulfatibia sp. TaxID=3101189 RepID=UPI002F31BD2A